MSVKYIPNGNTKIVIDKKTYQNDGEKKAVLPVEKIGKEELQRLVDRKLVLKLELDENGSSNSAKSAEKPKAVKTPGAKPGKEKNADNKPTPTREELLAEAASLGIIDQITDATTVEEIQQMIEEALGE